MITYHTQVTVALFLLSLKDKIKVNSSSVLRYTVADTWREKGE